MSGPQQRSKIKPNSNPPHRPRASDIKGAPAKVIASTSDTSSGKTARHVRAKDNETAKATTSTHLRPSAVSNLSASKQTTTVSGSETLARRKVEAAYGNKPASLPVNKSRTGIDSHAGKSGVTKVRVVRDAKTAAVPKLQSKSQPPPQPASSVSSKNVMNTIHNVTIASPTMKRKEASEEEVQLSKDQPSLDTPQKPRSRTRTRTIDPEESVMQRILQQKNATGIPAVVPIPIVPPAAPLPPPPPEPTPSPIAFEISLESTGNSEKEEEDDYEDDFESYESDFESEPSEESAREEGGAEEEDDEQEMNCIESDIINREEERKLDSGNYDLPSVSKDRPLLAEIQESVEQQPDLSLTQVNVGNTSPKHAPMRVKDFPVAKVKSINSRNASWDTMTFHLFEQKPMEYDRFMRVFGHLNSSQATTQTKFDDVCHEEMQTEEIDSSHRWTQNPPEFSRKEMVLKSSRKYQEELLGVGVELDNEKDINMDWTHLSGNPIDYERLNLFLKNSSLVVEQIVEGQSSKENQMKKKTSQLLNCCEVSEIHSEMKERKIKSVHGFGDVIVLVVEDNQRNEPDILEIYNATSPTAPQSVLVSWNKITSVLIHSKCLQYLLGGTNDGCINLWNWRSSSSTQEQDESVLRKRPPIATFIPAFLSHIGEFCPLVKIVEITTATNYSISGEDVAALYSPGVIIIWSLEAINGKVDLKEMKNIELTSKSSIPRGMKSKFEKNVTYFENNIFSDAALKELQTVKAVVDQAQNLMFVDLLFDGEVLISISNQNFITTTTMGLTNELKRIIVTESCERGVIRGTSAAVFSPGVILIGLSDGTLKVQCIASRQQCSTNAKNEDFEEEGQVSSDVDKNHELVAEKSCAIQNIVLNERKLYSDLQAKRNLDSLEANNGQSSTQKRSETKMELLERVLIHGNYFRRSAIKDIQVAGTAIYFVDQKELKVFDLTTEQLIEMKGHTDGGTNGISLAKDRGRGTFLIVNSDNSVHLHKMDGNVLN